MNETVILLHGFPASAGSWKPVATKLAAHHLRVLALEQRGYSPGAQPKDLRSYIIDELVEDVLALLQATNTQAAHIVGHDWGGAVAWAFASRYPEHTLSLTSVSTPHPNAFSQALHSSKQALMSWYMFFFQLPFLPEWIMRANQGKLLTRYLVHSGLNEKAALSYTRRMLGNNTLHYALAVSRPALQASGAYDRHYQVANPVHIWRKGRLPFRKSRATNPATGYWKIHFYAFAGGYPLDSGRAAGLACEGAFGLYQERCSGLSGPLRDCLYLSLP
jgi:pimeloyl-ACP methyl ester carboxylesterase